jgi:hypothetical protein
LLAWQGPSKAEQAPCTPPKAGKLTVKAIKSFEGMEGLGFNCSLYEDGKRMGAVIDEGRGGSFLYRLKGDAGGKKERELQRWARVQAQCGYSDQLDIVVAGLVEDAENEKRLKRLCRKQTVAKLETDDDGEHSVWKVPYSPEFAAKIRAKFPVVEIVNERFVKVAK